MPLHAGFEAYRRDCPDGVALIIPSSPAACRVSFARLDDSAAILAVVIIDTVQRESASRPDGSLATVGICCRRGEYNVLAVLAALKVS